MWPILISKSWWWLLKSKRERRLYIIIYSSSWIMFFLLPSYCRILIHIYFHTVLSEKQIPNTILHDIYHGWFQTISIYENLLVIAYFSTNGRSCLDSLGNPTFSNMFLRARHVLMTFELWTLCARLCIFSLYISHLLQSSQPASIAMWTILISKPWW